MLESIQDDTRAELYGTGHVHDDIDLRRARDGKGIFGNDRDAAAYGLVDGLLAPASRDVLATGIAEDVEGTLGLAVVNGRHAHAWHAVGDLVRQSLAHEAGADHADAYRPAFGFPCLQCIVDDDHVLAPAGARLIRRLTSGSTSPRSFHCASFGDIDATGSGQSSPSRGSSNL